MKLLVVMVLMTVSYVFAAGVKRNVAQVIDEKTWNEADKDK